MNHQKQSYSEDQSFQISDRVDIEGQSFGFQPTNDKIVNAEVKIQYHEFVASDSARFKQHIVSQLRLEYELLKDYRNWVYILIGFIIIYLHVAAHNLAYYMADPSAPLHDLMHSVIPELSNDSMFFSMNSYMLLFMFSFIVFTCFSKLFVKYPAVLRKSVVGFINRFFMVINITQLMRISTFLVTQVPAPSPNCREPFFDPPKHFIDIFNQAAGSGDKGCGDLIFSSHVMFGLLIVLIHIKYLSLSKYERVESKSSQITLSEINQYEVPPNNTFTGTQVNSKKKVIVFISRQQYIFRMLIISFLIFCFVSDIILILASRKHYTVDVVIALYVTFMVWYIMEKKYKDPKIPEHLADK